ncbi:MAG: toprim domain-containing protein [Rhodomicrobium sp.]
MLSHAHASVPRSRPRRNIHEEIRGRELEIITALGIQWPPGNHATHIHCPFPDHDDKNASWRWDSRKNRWHCSRDHGVDGNSVVDAVRLMHRCDFNTAAKWCRATLFGDRPPLSFTVEDRVAREFEREEDRRKKREEDEARWRAVQRRAIEIVESHDSANPCHPRLLCKKVGAHGILQMEDKLVIPMKNAGGEIWNVQLIHPDGEKRNLAGGLKRGLALRVGHPCENRIFVLAEGYTTAASIYEASGLCTIVTFGKDNILPVARSLRAKYPDARLFFAADDDRKADGLNPGVEAATEAAVAVGGIVVTPDFGPAREEGEKDFNDLACRLGPDAVKAQIMAAVGSA